MSIQQEYRTIFEREILQKSKSIIFSYSPLQDTINTFHTLTQYRPPP